MSDARELLRELVEAWDKASPEDVFVTFRAARTFLAAKPHPVPNGEVAALIHDLQWCAEQLYDGKKGEELLAMPPIK